MALTYTAQDELCTLTEALTRRVAQCAVGTAIEIMAEASATPGHSERAALAQRVLNSPLDLGRLMARAVATNPNSGSGLTDDPLLSDAALYWIVKVVLWDAFAGYTAN